ncbi:hypothetical protein [Rhodococcus marinonascens]|uniref:hypothetical protein n=1 Tax=Rhodococcus marinonascens TaxID=38311 RepID=UPI000933C68C|nr:hypothetical protein [Rhodococcus marinonascens]
MIGRDAADTRPFGAELRGASCTDGGEGRVNAPISGGVDPVKYGVGAKAVASARAVKSILRRRAIEAPTAAYRWYISGTRVG